VIDTGAWIGDFIAYVVAFKETIVCAFEQIKETFQWLFKMQRVKQ
jgi:hypothetical protein